MTKKYNLKQSVDLSKLPAIKGYDFEKKFNFDNFIKSFSTLGIQASNLSYAINITNSMIREKTPIFLSFTSNIISSGLRDIITYLVKQKKVAIISTSAGGIEEDVMKVIEPFRVGDFNVKGVTLFDSGVKRIGNIFTTDNHYTYLEFFMEEVFKELLKQKNPITPVEICKVIGKLMEQKKEFNHKESYLYWAYKNKIPVYCPGLVDGAIGDLAYYFKKSHPEFEIETLTDHEKLIDYTINCEKTAALILGGGISKHYILNANIFKDGFDYVVYITTATEFDASDSGGNPEEAISWGKIKTNAVYAKVNCEASIAFPLLVAATFTK